jgi:hypothetical protein
MQQVCQHRKPLIYRGLQQMRTVAVPRARAAQSTVSVRGRFVMVRHSKRRTRQWKAIGASHAGAEATRGEANDEISTRA